MFKLFFWQCNRAQYLISNLILLSALFLFNLDVLAVNDLPSCGVSLDYQTQSECVNSNGKEVSTQYWISREEASDSAGTSAEATTSKAQEDIQAQRDQAEKGATIMTGVSAALISIGIYCLNSTSSCEPQANTYLIMGGMSLAQVFANEQYIAGAEETLSGLANDCDGVDGDQVCAVNNGDDDGIANLDADLSSNPKLKSVIDKLKESGINLDLAKGTITTGKGSFPLSAANSPSGMKAMGFGGVDEAFARMDKATLKLGGNPKVTRMALGGGAGGGYGGSSTSGADPFAGLFDRFNTKRKKRKPASVKGKSKLIAGQKIGVKGDDIFEMVHRSYLRKSRNNGFVK